MTLEGKELSRFVDRAERDWTGYAKEKIAVEYIKGTLYGYGSELAVLRLEHKYNCPKARAFFSKNLNTWTFALDI
jgi:hypothetical protein